MISRIPTTIDTTGLASRFLLNGNALDSVGGRNGTWTGTEKYLWDQDMQQMVAYFNGASYISFSPAGLPAGTSEGTICGWVKTRSTDGITLVSYGTFHSTLNQERTLYHSSGNARAAIGNNTSIAAGFSLISDGTWHHLCACCTQTTLTFLVDGVLQAAASMVPATILSSGNIGRWIYGNQYMNGYITDVRIYNTAKTAAQILAICKLAA